MKDIEKSETDENHSPKYKAVIPDHPDKLTLLHMLAQRDLVDFAEIVINKYPGIVHCKSKARRNRILPIELALEHNHDGIASFIASKMSHEKYVVSLQQSNNKPTRVTRS